MQVMSMQTGLIYVFGSLTIKCPKDLGIKKKKYEKYPEKFKILKIHF